MRNYIANFVKVLDIYKEFAGDRVNGLGVESNNKRKIRKVVWIGKILEERMRSFSQVGEVSYTRKS